VVVVGGEAQSNLDKRCEFALKIINDHAMETIPKMPESVISNIEEVISALKTDHNELQKENPTQKIVELNQQLLALQHREILCQYFQSTLKVICIVILLLQQSQPVNY
jgi:CRISPR-associated protein Cas8b1/Cst1 subtype I-B